MAARSSIFKPTARKYTRVIAALIAVVFGLLLGRSSSADTPQMVLQFGLGGYGWVSMSPNGAYMATPGGRGAVLSNPKTGVILTYLTPPLAKTLKPTGICSAVFSPDSCLLALGDSANRISIWNTRTETFVRAMQIPGTEGQIRSM